ncbi:unnamed protein product, partial [Ectocarpus sp. 8 AP-2014]
LPSPGTALLADHSSTIWSVIASARHATFSNPARAELEASAAASSNQPTTAPLPLVGGSLHRRSSTRDYLLVPSRRLAHTHGRCAGTHERGRSDSLTMKGGPRGDVDRPAVAEAAAARSSSPGAPGLPLETFAGYSRETLSMRVYEPKEAAVTVLERQLALNRREIASARASTQQQPGSNGVLGSASAGGFPGGHTRATEEESAQARELYRMHRLHLLEQRKLRQQQGELSGSQQQQQQQQHKQQQQQQQESQQPRNRILDDSQQQQQQNGVLDGAALVRLLDGDLSQLGSPSEQQQQLRPREQEHHQQEQEQRVSGEDPEEALDDAKTR